MWGKTQIYCLQYYTHSTVVVGDLISCAAPGVASCWLSDSVFSNLSLWPGEITKSDFRAEPELAAKAYLAKGPLTTWSGQSLCQLGLTVLRHKRMPAAHGAGQAPSNTQSTLWHRWNSGEVSPPESSHLPSAGCVRTSRFCFQGKKCNISDSCNSRLRKK